MKRIAICFYGLTRSLRHTYPKLRENVLNVLGAAGYEFDVYLHTYNKSQLTNKRSNEKNCPLDLDEWKLLEPLKGVEITDQDEFDAQSNWQRFRQFGDAWKDGFASLQNLGRQLNSLQRVTSMCLDSGIDYAAVLFLRPDLLYHEPFDLRSLEQLLTRSDSAVLVTASWQKYGGLNDRFAMATRSAALIYGNRIQQCDEFCAELKKPLHSEQLVGFVARKNNLELLFTSMKASRVRANGIIVAEPWRY